MGSIAPAGIAEQRDRPEPRSCAGFRHPTQTTLVRLCLYALPAGFLVTEERAGSTTVPGTLGVFASREEAAAFADRRADDLLAQRWQQVEEP